MNSTVPMTQEQNTMPFVHERLLGVLAPAFSGSTLGAVSDIHVENVRVDTRLRFCPRVSVRRNILPRG